MSKQFSIISKIMGILIAGFSLTFLPPIIISLIYADHQSSYFLYTFFFTAFFGLLLWFPQRNKMYELKTRHGFIIVALFWSVLSVVCAIPLYLSSELNLSLVHAIFESTSGFTTTGATILSQLDTVPKSILWYRTQLHFFGGMGIIILAVAIMPLLGMGGMALFKAEIPGPMKEEKMNPRIAQTARNLWFVYLALLISCIIAYLIGGMSLFDAITHGFSTIATAGFANYDNSFAHFNSETINWICIFFMFLGGINFTLHFFSFRDKKITRYINNLELQVFVLLCIIAILITTATLYYYGTFQSINRAFHNAVFLVVSMITTTGFLIDSFHRWPTFLPLFIIFISFIGGCAGSTSGGIKVVRIILLCKQSLREIQRLIHPRAQLPVRLDGKIVPDSILGSVWAFLGLYAFSTVVLTIIMIGLGLEPMGAFTAVAGCLNITGPALGSISGNYSSISHSGLLVLTFTMLLGRLEIFTIFVLLTPSFWRG